MKKGNKNKSGKSGSRNKLLSLFIVVICFTIAFVILIEAQQKNTYNSNMKEDSFNIKSEYGKTLVARDTKAIYPRYYVVTFSDEEYAVYVYNYYETVSQYELEFSQLIDDIVDYNTKDKMIRYLYTRGYGTYQEVQSNLSAIVDNNNLLIY